MRDDHMFDIDSESEDEFEFSGEEQDDNVDSDDNGSVASGMMLRMTCRYRQQQQLTTHSKLPVSYSARHLSAINASVSAGAVEYCDRLLVVEC
jgi:hypothetical protein